MNGFKFIVNLTVRLKFKHALMNLQAVQRCYSFL